MISLVCQRWRTRRAAYRPAGEVIRTRDYDVATFVLIIALAIAIAPFILGVLGTMLGLILTFILWAFAGFPDNPSHPVKDPKGEAAIEQLEKWEAEDTARELEHRAREAAKAVKARVGRVRARAARSLGDAQARDPEALEGMGHDEP